MTEPEPRTESTRATRGARGSLGRLARWARDPVVRFVVLGALIFGAHRLFGANDSNEPIVVSSRFVEGLVAEHRQRFGREPSPSERDQLVAQWAREEALVREARTLRLDRGDPIVRRRLSQKMELVLRGAVTVDRPNDDAIRAYIAAHPDEVARDERYTFRHAFASRDLRPDARADATAFVESLRGTRDPASAVVALGDGFALGPELTQVTGEHVAERFGPAFRAGVADCELRRPCGPLESSFGFHAVVLLAREPAGTMPFAAARPIAERAILRQREDAALERAIEALLVRHHVVRVDDGHASAEGSR